MINRDQLKIAMQNIIDKAEGNDKQLYKCIYYDLDKILAESEIQEKHFENQIKKYKFYKSKPEIDKLNEKIKSMEEEILDLKSKLYFKERENKSITRHLKKLHQFYNKDLYKKEIDGKITKILKKIDNYKSDLKDIADILEDINDFLEGEC